MGGHIRSPALDQSIPISLDVIRNIPTQTHSTLNRRNYQAFISGEIKALHKYVNIFTVCK